MPFKKKPLSRSYTYMSCRGSVYRAVELGRSANGYYIRCSCDPDGDDLSPSYMYTSYSYMYTHEHPMCSHCKAAPTLSPEQHAVFISLLRLGANASALEMLNEHFPLKVLARGRSEGHDFTRKPFEPVGGLP